MVKSHPEYSAGMRGAYIGVATKATSLNKAIQNITGELKNIDLVLVGLEEFYDQRFAEDEPSEYFQELIDMLADFLVGYKYVDLHPLN